MTEAPARNRPEERFCPTARRSCRSLGSPAALCAGFAVACATVVTLAEPRAILAEPAAPSGASAPRASAAATSAPSNVDAAPAESAGQSALGVKLSLGQSGFNASATRAAIGRELGVPVADTADDSTSRSWLDVRLDTADRATVNYCTPDGRCMGRTIDLPAQRDRALETIALLASNVARNEATELIAALERRAAAARASAETDQAAKAGSPAAPAGPVKAAARPGAPPAAAAAPKTPLNRALLSQEPGINLSLWHPIAILPDSDRRKLHLELGLGYSHVGALNGMGANALLARVDQQLEGVLVAGLGAWVGGDSTGVIAGGLGVLSQGKLRGAEFGGLASFHVGHGSGRYGVNAWSGASLEGIQSSGLWNHTAGDLVGVQTAGGGNTLVGSMNGLQAAGAVNWVKGDVDGLQAAGAVNWADGDVDGLQAAGAVNWVRGDVEGLQAASANISLGSANGLVVGVMNLVGLDGPSEPSRGFEAGVVNVDRSSFHGLQVGVVNVSGRQRGAQIGLVNVSDELDGVPVGLVNLGGNTDPSLVAFATSRTPANLGAKFVTGYTFTLVSFGYDPKGTSQGNAHEVLQSAAQFGGHIPFAAHGAIEPSIGYAYETYVNKLDASVDGGHVALYRAVLSWHFIPELGVFAGGGARQLISHQGDVTFEAEGLGGIEVF